MTDKPKETKQAGIFSCFSSLMKATLVIIIAISITPLHPLAVSDLPVLGYSLQRDVRTGE
jgi:hypothetical protein